MIISLEIILAISRRERLSEWITVHLMELIETNLNLLSLFVFFG